MSGMNEFQQQYEFQVKFFALAGHDVFQVCTLERNRYRNRISIRWRRKFILKFELGFRSPLGDMDSEETVVFFNLSSRIWI